MMPTLDDAYLAGLDHRQLGALWLLLRAAEAEGGALPDDDVLLAEAAGCGILLDHWRRLKRAVLRDWRRGADGLLRHAGMVAGAGAGAGADAGAGAVAGAGVSRETPDEAARPVQAVARAAAVSVAGGKAGVTPDWLRAKWRRQAKERRARARLGLVAHMLMPEAANDGRTQEATAGQARGGLAVPVGGLRDAARADSGADGADAWRGGRADSDSESSIASSSSQSSHPPETDAAREGAAGGAAAKDDAAAVAAAAAERVVDAFLEARRRRWPDAMALKRAEQRRVVLDWMGQGASEQDLLGHIRERMPRLREIAGSINAFGASVAQLIETRQRQRGLPLYGLVAGSSKGRGIEGRAHQPSAAAPMLASMAPWAERAVRERIMGPGQAASWLARTELRSERRGDAQGHGAGHGEDDGEGFVLLCWSDFQRRSLAQDWSRALDKLFGAGRWRLALAAQEEKAG